MKEYRIYYKYWNSFTKQYIEHPVYETKAKNFTDVLDKFYAIETESDGDIKALHITSIQKKTLFSWKEI